MRSGKSSRRVTSSFAAARRAGALALLSVAVLVGACKKDSASRRLESSAPPVGSAASTATQIIVVLGSSTSAGIGPSEPDNAWVPRYGRYLAERFPDFRVLNLASGGLTTYHIQPSGFSPPPARPVPARGRNITAALALSPRAVVVNMPSNDAAEGYSPAEQLANFERVSAAAEAAHVPLWVTTTQPRNFGTAHQLQAQVEVRDAILRRFAPRALDFWTPFATPSRKLAPRFDAGDGTHLNDAAHALISQRVADAGIPQAVTSQPVPP
jgi:lysophospholipase L1-like esterase